MLYNDDGASGIRKTPGTPLFIKKMQANAFYMENLTKRRDGEKWFREGIVPARWLQWSQKWN